MPEEVKTEAAPAPDFCTQLRGIERQLFDLMRRETSKVCGEQRMLYFAAIAVFSVIRHLQIWNFKRSRVPFNISHSAIAAVHAIKALSETASKTRWNVTLPVIEEVPLDELETAQNDLQTPRIPYVPPLATAIDLAKLEVFQIIKTPKRGEK